MKLIKLCAISLFLLVLALPIQAGVIANDMDNIDFVAFVPCADNGNGELIEGTGRLHVLFREEFDSAGGTHYGNHFQPMGLKATGATTGDRYNANGVTQGSTNVGSGGLPLTDTYINNYRMVGTGGNAVSYHVHTTYHITINANGELTAFVDDTRITCE